jgi:hypothetical protein
MALRKGVNPISGGMSKATMALLDEETRAKYGDDGRLLDGTIDLSPLDKMEANANLTVSFTNTNENPLIEEEQQKPIEEEVKAPTTVTLTLEEIDELIEKKLASKQQNVQPVKSYEDDSIKKQATAIKNVIVDDIPELRDFEVRDRIYVLSDGSKPISRNIPTRHKNASPLQYINRDTNEVHALFYSLTQTSFFKDQHKGDSQVAHVFFKDGMLKTYRDDIKLQKFLAINPHNEAMGGSLFKEYNPSEEADKAMEKVDLVFHAETLARNLPFTKQKAIARVLCEDFKDSWTVSELKHAFILRVKASPEKFNKLANDPKLEMKEIARIAIERGFLDYRNYKFFNDKNEVILEVQRNDDEYESIANYFLSSQGRTFYEFLKNSID